MRHMKVSCAVTDAGLEPSSEEGSGPPTCADAQPPLYSPALELDTTRSAMYSSIHVSKGCVAKCTFCQRGAKGYSTYELKDLEKHLEQLKKYDVGFLSVDDENFGSNKKYTYEVAQLFHKHRVKS